MSTSQPRTPAGSPDGGQFAETAGSEAGVSLAVSDDPFHRRYDSLDDKLKAFQAELAVAVEQLRDDEQWLDYLQTMSRFHNYSAQNQLLIWIQRPDATIVAGFNKWKDLGRHVLKGEHGIQILAPKVRTVDADQGDEHAFFDKRSGRWKRRWITGFTTAAVFDVAQTDGKDLPEGRRELSGDPPAGFTEDLEAAITARGFSVEYVDDLGGSSGATSPTGKTVQIVKSLSPADRASTLAHELGHIQAGHLEQMDEYHSGHGGRRSQMEVEAEAISYVLCRTNGMDVAKGGHHDRYISGWGGVTAAADEVRKATETIQKSVKAVLGDGSWRNVAPR